MYTQSASFSDPCPARKISDSRNVRISVTQRTKRSADSSILPDSMSTPTRSRSSIHYHLGDDSFSIHSPHCNCLLERRLRAL